MLLAVDDPPCGAVVIIREIEDDGAAACGQQCEGSDDKSERYEDDLDLLGSVDPKWANDRERPRTTVNYNRLEGLGFQGRRPPSAMRTPEEPSGCVTQRVLGSWSKTASSSEMRVGFGSAAF